MDALVLESHDGPQSLRRREVLDPNPHRGEVVVDIQATALNRADLLQTKGLYPGPPAEHEIPGLELAGRVIAVGDGVIERDIGDRVMALVGGGAFAEKVALPANHTLPVPEGVDVLTAGGVMETFVTAWDAIVVQGGLRSGMRVLIHGGASGVGTSAIQVARCLDADVAVTCSAGKHEAVRSLGADLVLDYRDDDLKDRLRDWAPSGIDVILDMTGASTLALDLAVVATKGTIVVIGLLGGRRAEIDLARLMMKRARLVGSVLRSRSDDEKADLVQAFGRAFLPFIADGSVGPVVDRVIAFDDIPAGLELLATDATVGKVVIDLRQTP